MIGFLRRKVRSDAGPVGRRQPSRLLLSLFFLIHFGAIGVYVLPFGPTAYDRLPDPLERLAERAVVTIKYRGLLPSLGYLNMFSLQQHWTLFGPEPIRWANSVTVQAYFPASPDVGPSPPERVPTWNVRQFRIVGPRETPGLHLGHHRPWRILSNLGYQGWGAFYRPLMAEVLCRRIAERTGEAPAGLTMRATWEEVALPWKEAPPDPVHGQHLGGFDCPPP
ncbi:MAG: hypothetical protein OEO23_17080 [Gemmatimonadota bacterium]|nr:hypothetical protein [Gemmatimonadota bacterium]